MPQIRSIRGRRLATQDGRSRPLTPGYGPAVSKPLAERHPGGKAWCGSGSLALQFLRDPYLDHGLSSDPKPLGLAIERIDHPRGEVDVDTARSLIGTGRAGQVEVIDDVLGTLVELLIEISR